MSTINYSKDADGNLIETVQPDLPPPTQNAYSPGLIVANLASVVQERDAENARHVAALADIDSKEAFWNDIKQNAIDNEVVFAEPEISSPEESTE